MICHAVKEFKGTHTFHIAFDNLTSFPRDHVFAFNLNSNLVNAIPTILWQRYESKWHIFCFPKSLRRHWKLQLQQLLQLHSWYVSRLCVSKFLPPTLSWIPFKAVFDRMRYCISLDWHQIEKKRLLLLQNFLDTKKYDNRDGFYPLNGIYANILIHYCYLLFKHTVHKKY